ncbi:MAG TPA: DUF2188 domain-containing protein [Baekduia sp.]|nr:DUF2188 domain-containing protein [Baekduia sp.]
MPDVHIHRHGDRWAVTLAGDDAPVFESYTREEAESEGRQRAEGGAVRVDDADGGTEHPDADREVDVRQPEELRPGGHTARPGETFRETQAGI